MSDFAFHDLPATSFPFEVELIRPSDGAVVFYTRVEGPGAVRIPGRLEHGSQETLKVRVTWGDGTVTES